MGRAALAPCASPRCVQRDRTVPRTTAFLASRNNAACTVFAGGRTPETTALAFHPNSGELSGTCGRFSKGKTMRSTVRKGSVAAQKEKMFPHVPSDGAQSPSLDALSLKARALSELQLRWLVAQHLGMAEAESGNGRNPEIAPHVLPSDWTPIS